MRTPKLTQEELVNYWLQKAYNVTLDDLPTEVKMSDKFFKNYSVSQSAHDEWYDWAIQRIMKVYRIGKKSAKKQFAFPYLNVAPSIINENK